MNTSKRGLVIGELLVAFVLLAVAVSSLTALMYSVTRNPRTQAAQEACAERGASSSPECVKAAKASATGKKLLVSGCATRSGTKVEGCTDQSSSSTAAGATTLRSRTDSASLQLLPKKTQRPKRPDLNFIR